jgi:hypothetical protein
MTTGWLVLVKARVKGGGVGGERHSGRSRSEGGGGGVRLAVGEALEPERAGAVLPEADAEGARGACWGGGGGRAQGVSGSSRGGGARAAARARARAGVVGGAGGGWWAGGQAWREHLRT